MTLFRYLLIAALLAPLQSNAAGWLPLVQSGGGSVTTIFNNSAITGDNSSPAGWTWRALVGVGGGSGTLHQVRVTLRSSNANPWATDHCAIGVYAGSWSATTATPIELTFSGLSGFSIGTSTDIVSDWVTIPSFTSSDSLLVIMDASATSGDDVAGSGTPTLGSASTAGGQAGASYNVTNPASFANFGPSAFAVKLIETR